MSFNLDATKPAQEAIFNRKLKTVPHPSITFNNNPSSLYRGRKHLGLVLDSKLIFNKHIKHILSKVNKSIELQYNFKRSFQDHHSLLFRIHLSVVISSTLTLFMSKVKNRRLTKKSSRFNTMLLWQAVTVAI